MEELFLRPATEADARELLLIYAPYVLKSAVTFEYETPSEAAFAKRISSTLSAYPYLVAQRGEEVLGYAYTAALKERAAYERSAQVSIYLKGNARGQGIGTALYEALELILKRQNVQNLYACITSAPQSDAPEGDAHLDGASEAFHARMGYRKIGRFTACGYKFSTWYDTIWMEKMLGDHPVKPKAFIPFPELK